MRALGSFCSYFSFKTPTVTLKAYAFWILTCLDDAAEAPSELSLKLAANRYLGADVPQEGKLEQEQ